MVPGIHFSNVFYFGCSTDVLLTFSSMYHDWCSAWPPTKETGLNHVLFVFFNRPAGFCPLKAENSWKLQCKLPMTSNPFAKQSAAAVRLQPWKLFLRWRASWLYVVQTNIYVWYVSPDMDCLGIGVEVFIWWRVLCNTACFNMFQLAKLENLSC